MVQPYNYNMNVAPFDPLAGIMRGVQLGTAMQEQARARQEAEAKAQEQAALRQAMIEFGQAKTPAEQVAVMERYPMFAKPISEQWQTFDEATRKPIFDAGLKGYSLLTGGDAGGAARVWRETGAAFRNSNKPELAKQFDDMATIAEKDGKTAAMMASAFLAGTDGKRFKEFGDSLSGRKDDTSFQRDYMFIKDTYGQAAADAFANNRTDPMATIPLPGGKVYVGPRSGIAGALGAAPPKPEPPRIGTIEDGYRFKGGDPKDAKNWEKVR